MVPNTYNTVATEIPRIVDCGIVRSGSRTSPAGTVADSSPRYANIVSGASAALAVSSDWPLGLNSAKWLTCTNGRPSSAIAAKGTSFA